jgi:hypothetical protein
MFVAGGAVQAGGGIYLERDADRDLLRHCLAGDFTYILTSRQMGKSSLMYRAAEELARQNIVPVIIDLTELGAQTTADQWYKGFLLRVQEHLDLRESASAWWDAHQEYAVAQRLIRYLREVALVERKERLVLFVDEIDTTLRLDFTDDFFAAIRFLYQGRARDPELERISFVLIGVATPNDLIKDSARTPFNIGRRIELTDFTAQEAAVLAVKLAVPPDAAGGFIDAILHWTSGHPYLTMRAIRSLAETPPPAWSTSAVDARVRELFFGPGGESDTNLQFVRDMLTKKAFNREAVLATYDAIRRGASVPDKELDQVASWLKLSGIVRRQDGLLRVRNAIYEQVFDQGWTRVHRRLHIDWRRRLARAAAALLVLIVLVTIPLAVYAMRQRNVADGARQQAEGQRDEAERQRTNAETQRDRAEQQLLTTTQNLQTAQEAVAALKEFDPKAAASLSVELTAARTTADQQLATLTQERERLRKDRDDAQAQARRLEQENTALKQEQSRPPNAGTAGSVVVPNLVGRSTTEVVQSVAPAALAIEMRVVDSDRPRDTIVSQRPAPGVQVARGTVLNVSVSAGPPPPGSRATGARAGDDTAQILRTLQRYKAAYEALDARAVLAVQPGLNVSSLQARFNEFSRMTYDLRVAVDGVAIAADGQTASVSASETIRPVSKSVRVEPVIRTALFLLKKTAGDWLIQSVSPTGK